MGLFRRAKPLHEQLAEQADLDIGADADGEAGQRTPSRLAGLMHGLADGFLSAPPDEFGRPSPFGEVALHGVARPREWDTIVTVAAELPGDEVHFASLPDGTLVVEEDVPDGALNPLADAIEASISGALPRRGRPPRRLRLGGRREADPGALVPGQEGDELELVEDGQIVIGRRLDGDLFEVEVSPL